MVCGALCWLKGSRPKHKTAAVERVVAPIASHLCHLVLLCDGAEDPEHFTQLEGAAQAVAKATENMAAEASRVIRDTEDEVLHVEMSSLFEYVTVSGQHVLLAAQKLNIQPSLTEHREELITATQNVFLGVVKVLLVEDDANIRRVVAASDQVLECLSDLGSSIDIKSLLKYFQVFSEALLILHSLTMERANALQDPRQTEQLLDSLETLRRCISMLHTAMCTTIKHPTSEEAQAAKRYILDKVQSTVNDIIKTLRIVTVTKGKDVTELNRACTGVLELSNCYAQATKEAMAIVDAVDCKTLDRFRAEVVSLTPLLVQTAQETAMSSAMSMESLYKHSTQFTDLINNTRKISDIISRARLMVETHYICDTLSLDVQIQCWSAKAHYVVEEVRKQDGIHQEAKEQIMMGLQGKTYEDVREVLATVPSKDKEVEFRSDTTMTSWQKGHTESVNAAEPNMNMEAVAKFGPGNVEKYEGVWFGTYKETPSLTHTSLFLKQESDSWDPKDNRIVQVTRKMADTLCYMTQYLKKKGPIPNKEAFVTAAKDVISNSQSVTQFLRVIANHCLDKQCTVELSLVVEQILTIANQLNIISCVNAVTPGCKSSDEILVKNTQNLLQTVLRGVHAAESACITGLRQPEPNSDGAEATDLCFQWMRKLEIHRAQQTSNPETDELGLRKTSSHPVAPSLASPVGYK
ncbi:hypothetical protein CgunFtcFv8_016392 [Champsocephalus gunnari]|uniref:Uncharacterized protein n=1 Tax=Champsocephalus gunnari TaxID=52237 RepID=A0AAN8CS08_CHAGU|nr:hypothetical protein CgunFtcFv8_016392 [Champsocephalus gunnari]